MKEYICKRCKASFKCEEELIEHKKYLHGEYPLQDHLNHKLKDDRVHKIWMKYYGGIKQKKVSKPFNPKKVYEEYLQNCKVSEPTHKPNDPDIPEEDRIYSPNKKFWCKKTSKDSAVRFFKSLEKLKEDMKTRGTRYVPVPIEDKVAFGRLKISNHKPQMIDILYIHDENSHSFRMYTNELKYGDWLEIVFSKKKQCFVLKDIDKLRAEWNRKHNKSVITNVDVLEVFNEMR